MSLRFGVIGCGVIAYWTHLRLLSNLRNATLVAAADPDPAARERARQLTGLAIDADPAALLARPEVDAVIISAPTGLHAPLAIAAAQAGKHIYLEKPIAIDAPGLERLEAAVRDSGVRFATGFNRRHHPLFVEARRCLDAGAIGPVRAVFSSFCEPLSQPGAMPAWKRERATGGGVLLDLGSHHIDLLRWFLRAEVTRSDLRLSSVATEHDEAWLSLRFTNAVESSAYFSFRAGRADFFEFLGEHGTLRVDRHRASLVPRVSRSHGYGVRSALSVGSRDLWAWRLLRLARPSYDPSYRLALQAFVDGHPGATLEDGRRSLDVILAAEGRCASC